MFAGIESVGAVLSILIVTEAEFVRPALLEAEHVKLLPAVFVLRLEVVQPVEDRMPDWPSVTDQLNDTLLVYQPFDPAVPLMLGVIAGAVLSKIVASL